jgi:hypothetical protein
MGEVYWQFKSALFPAVAQAIVDYIPGLKSDVWKSLTVGLPHEIPYGGNQCHKNKSGYDLEVVWGICPFSSLSSDLFAEMKSLNSFFCDETIVEIMKHITGGKDPSTWTELEGSFAYSNGKIPANIHCNKGSQF